MSDRAYVTTRKGLFTLARNGGGGWSVDRTAFLGDNGSIFLADRRDGALYMALAHGHFGLEDAPLDRRRRDVAGDRDAGVSRAAGGRRVAVETR
jgi:hypothetical protein